MTHPNLETIQASLVIGNVLAYNMNPGVAYIFVGMVIRMALSIGLQMNTAGFTEHENWLRRRVWWALAWQDSHFSISYDRPSATTLCHPDIPYTYGSAPGSRSYAESMYSIISLTQEIIRERSLGSRSQMNYATIQRYKEIVSTIVTDGVPHLRERSLCIKMTQHLERLALKLHSCYITSELCRPALKEANDERPEFNPVQSPPGRRRKGSGSQSSGPGSARSPSQSETSSIISQLRRDCVRSLEGAVEAYVELHGLSEFAARSWIGIQRSISAAFLLGTLHETNQEPRILNLLRELERCIAQRTMDDPTFEKLRAEDVPGQQQDMLSSDGMPLTEAPHWARSMTRSLGALGKLNATLAGYKAGTSKPNIYPAQATKHDYPTPTSSFPNLQSKAPMPRNQYPSQQPLPPIKLIQPEPYSPTVSGLMAPSALGGLNTNLGPITPDSMGSGSASAGEWNYGNLKERGAEWIQPALWK